MKPALILIIIFLPIYSYAQKTEFMDLYESEAPNSLKILEKDEIGEGGRIISVSKPELTIYHPDPEKATGQAILVFPGGGYSIIAIQHEGHEIAEWYSNQGVLAAVLKYRLPDPELVTRHWDIPLDDAKAAILKIRSNAKQWSIQENQVGVLGFSAGGHLAASLSVHGKTSQDQALNTRPDFSILIYPVISMDPALTHQGSRSKLLGQKMDTEYEVFYSNEKHVDINTPPAFLVHSWDDTAVPVQNSIAYAQALADKKIKTELHLFQKGGHGYGKGNAAEHGNASQWLSMSLKWIQDLL